MRLCVLTTFLCSLHVLACAEVSTVLYEAQTLCDIQSRLESNCSEVTGSKTDLLDCARSCARNDACHALSVDTAGRCYQHQSCPALAVCEQVNDNHHYFQKLPCLNGGTWDNATSSCRCTGGWVGSTCSELAQKCLDLRADGYPVGYYERVYLMPPGVTKPFQVECNVKEAYTDTVLAVNVLGMDFNRSWSEYKSGFFDPEDGGGFWVGLDNVVAAFSAPYSHSKRKLNVHLTTYDSILGMSGLLWMYDNVHIAHESQGFELTISVGASSRPIYSGYDSFNATEGIEDCLLSIDGSRFTTFDVDNDEDPTQNCAALVGTGWWFKSCTPECHPFGRLYSQTNPEPITNDRIRFPNFNIRASAASSVRVSIMLYDKL